MPANSPAQPPASQTAGFGLAADFAPPSQVHSNSGANQSQSLGANFAHPTATGRPGGGQTSSEIAQSFGTADPPAPTTKSNTALRIPHDRLSFLILEDQIKFTNLFKSAVGDGQALEGQPLATWKDERQIDADNG